jgi:hypothetical protein
MKEQHYYNVSLQTPSTGNEAIQIELTFSEGGMSLSCALGKRLGNASCVDCVRVLCHVAR